MGASLIEYEARRARTDVLNLVLGRPGFSLNREDTTHMKATPIGVISSSFFGGASCDGNTDPR